MDTIVLFDIQIWLSLITLTTLEIVLGIDNIIFISIVSSRLPKHQQELSRKLGLSLALIGRLGLLLSLSWIMHLTKPLFQVWNYEISGRALIFFVGGLFLLYKATQEIFFHLEGVEEKDHAQQRYTLKTAIFQILLLDIVFSLDSVITAIGIANVVWVMAVAMVIAVLVMLLFSGGIARFIDSHPSMKVLALAFLVMVGVLLVVEAFGHHVPKGYVYFAMAFSVGVEFLNIRYQSKRKRAKPVSLRQKSP